MDAYWPALPRRAERIPTCAGESSVGKRIRVLVVDDSALVRKLLTEMLSSDPEIEVVDTAQDPFVAREKIKLLNPDVLTLDVEMPRMDGVTFLRNLMRLRPMPVVMVSTLTEKGAEITLDALRYGAVDFITKPKVDIAYTLQDYREELISKIKAASIARVRQLTASTTSPDRVPGASVPVDKVLPAAPRQHFRTTDRLIAIGASTGGTEAIREVLERLPGVTTPGIVITQHIPASFSGPFAQRMNRCSQLEVSEARDGEQILPGHAYIAPGDQHLMVIRDGARYRCRLSSDVPVNRHRPSVDVLFRSVAQNVGPNALGVILTGMGKDGALGMKDMRDAGAHTIAQDEASSVVWGMPGAAVACGGAAETMPLDDIPAAILRRMG
jgi:two-component system, chemotaxis family, protein-glutamate methylesterase/glutaminase